MNDASHLIEILALDGSVADELAAVSSDLAREIGLPIAVRRARRDADDLVEADRGQVEAGRLLDRLRNDGRPALRRIGVTRVDLYRRGVAFEMGETELDGEVGVVSTHRLREESYGLEPDRGLLRTRLVKECLHEMAHAFGLGHCSRPGCVLNFSFDVSDVDAKGAAFCDHCRAELRKRVRREVRRRGRRPPALLRRPVRAAIAVFLLVLLLVPWGGGGLARAVPFSFSHDWHLDAMGLGCADCHVSDCGGWTPRPEVAACAACHEGKPSGNANLVSLERCLREESPAPWSPPGVPEAVHSGRVHRDEAACRRCHGDRCEDDAHARPGCCGDCHEEATLVSACASCHR